MMDFSHSLAGHHAVATGSSASRGRLCTVLPGGGVWSGRHFAASDFTAGAGFIFSIVSIAVCCVLWSGLIFS